MAALQALQQKGAASVSEVAAAQQRLQSADSALQGLQLRSTQRYSVADQARAKAQLDEAKATLAAAQNSYAGGQSARRFQARSTRFQYPPMTLSRLEKIFWTLRI